MASIPHFEAVKFTNNVSIQLDKHVVVYGFNFAELFY